ncbi:MAG: FkbM family methyltransferase [Desulfomonilaceae bacterium]
MDLQKVLRSYSKIRAIYKTLRWSLKQPRLISLLSDFVKPGDLVFDVGANVGAYVSIFLRLGAKVVAVEPQQDCLKTLRSKFGNDPRVSIEPVALGSREEQGFIYLSEVRNPISSMSLEWIEAVKRSGRFGFFRWGSPEPVSVTTMDRMISKYGVPSFCKIDAEGYEHQILEGLSVPVERLSFEYHVEYLHKLEPCLTALSDLGAYWFNFTIGQQPLFKSSEWLDAEALLKRLQGLSVRTLQGDIYGTLKHKRS